MRNVYVLGAIQTAVVTFVAGVVFLVVLAGGSGPVWGSGVDEGVPSPVGVRVEEDDPRFDCRIHGNMDCGESDV